MSNGSKSSTWWKVTLAVFIVYGCVSLYAGAVLLITGCCGQRQDGLMNILQILYLPTFLLGIRKPGSYERCYDRAFRFLSRGGIHATHS
jgi:hypothetical protein